MFKDKCGIWIIWAAPATRRLLRGPGGSSGRELPWGPLCLVRWASLRPPVPIAWGDMGWGRGHGWLQALPRQGWDHCLQPGWVAFAPRGPRGPRGCCPQGGQHNPLFEPLTSSGFHTFPYNVRFQLNLALLFVSKALSSVCWSTLHLDLPLPHLFAMFLPSGVSFSG